MGRLVLLQLVLAPAFMLSGALAGEGPEKAVAEELARLEGKWKIVAAEQGGEAIKSDDLVEFSGGKCTVTNPATGIPRDNWQVAWAESYLSEGGDDLLVDRWADAPKADSFRVAFFIHCWNPATPLRTSYGELRCPGVMKMPERLQKLVPYVPVD